MATLVNSGGVLATDNSNGKGGLTSGTDARIVSRWITSPLAPVVGCVDEAYGTRHGRFAVEDVSLAGARLRAPGWNFDPIPGDFLRCKLAFPSLGEVITKLRVRAVRPSSSTVEGCCELALHTEFCDVSELHIHLISGYLARFCTDVQLSVLRRDGIAPSNLGDFVEFTEERCTASSSTLVGSVMNEEVLRGRVRELDDCLIAEVAWAQPDLRSSDLLSSMISYLAPRAASMSGALILSDTGLEAYLTSLGFGRTNPRDTANRTLGINVLRAVSGRGVSATAWRDVWKPIRRRVAMKGDASDLPKIGLRTKLFLSLKAFSSKPPSDQSTGDVSWMRYALHYDKMCSINPAYEANIDLVKGWITRLATNDQPVVYDLGAGTGNACIEIASLLPRAQVHHVDNSAGMNLVARQKYALAGVENVHIVVEDLEQYEPPAQTADFIVCLHAAYTLKEPHKLLERALRCLKPNGYLLLIDIGRPIELRKWSAYCFFHATQRLGFRRAVSLFHDAWQVIRQNRNIHAKQQAGAYWSHDAGSLTDALKTKGFDVLEVGECYRGISDYAVCRAPATGSPKNLQSVI